MGRINIPLDKRNCFNCNSNTTHIDKTGRHHWRNVDGNPWCHKCYTNIIANPINNPKYRKRLLNYKYKLVLLKEEPRKGKCERCGKKIGDTYINYKGKEKIIKQTQMHHYDEYYDDDKLKDTIELCAHCHGQESAKKRYKDHDDLSKRLCKLCNKKTTSDWFRYEGGFICHLCYEKRRRLLLTSNS